MRMVPLTPEAPTAHFRQIAEMHTTEIHHGLLPQLGLDFLTALYRAISGVPYGAIIAAVKDQHIIGFVAGSRDLRQLYRHLLMTRSWLFLWHAWPRLIQGHILGKVWHVLRYPGRSIDRPWPSTSPRGGRAELLAIAVSGTYRRQGLGGRLLERFENRLKMAGNCPDYRVATNAAEAASNAFYLRHGFEMIGTQNHNDLTLQVYAKALQAPVNNREGS